MGKPHSPNAVAQFLTVAVGWVASGKPFRIFRKVLSHTFAVFLNRMLGNSALQLVNLLV